MPSSGTGQYGQGTIGTSGDAAVIVAFTPSIAGGTYTNIIIQNSGAIAGFFSIDGGQSWNPLTAQVTLGIPGGIFLNNQRISSDGLIQIQRAHGGSDLGGIFVSVL